MAGKSTPVPPAPELPTISPEEGVKLLREQIESGTKLCAQGSVKGDDYSAWRAETEAALIEAIGRNQQLVRDAVDAGSNIGAMFSDREGADRVNCQSLRSEVKHLEVCIRTLEKKIARQQASATAAPSDPGVALVRDVIKKGKDLLANAAMTVDDAETWRAAAEEALADTIGRDHPIALKALGAGAPIITIGMGRGQLATRYRLSIPSQLAIMEGACIPYLERQPAKVAAEASPQGADALDRLRWVLTRFHAIALSLRHRHASRQPLLLNDEYDVQDLLAALLEIDFTDIRPEEHVPSYAGKSTRMDFLLKTEQTVVEAKYAKAGHADKDIGSELIEDIVRIRIASDWCASSTTHLTPSGTRPVFSGISPARAKDCRSKSSSHPSRRCLGEAEQRGGTSLGKSLIPLQVATQPTLEEEPTCG